jgi:hypothetical protein
MGCLLLRSQLGTPMPHTLEAGHTQPRSELPPPYKQMFKVERNRL